jgi:hypothetical protein
MAIPEISRTNTLVLILTDSFGGRIGKVWTAAVGEAILSPGRGSVCHRPFTIGSGRMASCSASDAGPARVT